MQLVDETQASDARAKLMQLSSTRPEVVLLSIPPDELPNARIEVVRWSLPELYAWQEYASVPLTQWSLAQQPARSWGLGVKPRVNRISVQFTNDADRQSFDASVASYELPCELFQVQVLNGPIFTP